MFAEEVAWRSGANGFGLSMHSGIFRAVVEPCGRILNDLEAQERGAGVLKPGSHLPISAGPRRTRAFVLDRKMKIAASIKNFCDASGSRAVARNPCPIRAMGMRKAQGRFRREALFPRFSPFEKHR